MKWKREFRDGISMLIGADGRYKVVKYGKWCAFFKPKGWIAFGNSCRLQPNGKSCRYDKLKDAIADAEEHYAKFGDERPFFDRLPERYF